MSPVFQIDIDALLVFPFSIARNTLEKRNACSVRIANANARQILTRQWLIL